MVLEMLIGLQNRTNKQVLCESESRGTAAELELIHSKSFTSLMMDLWKAMEIERQHGQVIKQFYSTPAVINTDNKNQSPYLQIGQQLPLVVMVRPADSMGLSS